jgi:hypothetical protein
MISGMSDDDDKPDPIEDVRKGLGLLFRAAKSTIDKFPRDLEEAVTTGAREVGRAIENVGRTIERDILKNKPAEAPKPENPSKEEEPKPDEKPVDDKPAS